MNKLIIMNEITLCWHCNTEYPFEYESCPHCGVTNANFDMEKAEKELKQCQSIGEWHLKMPEGGHDNRS